MKNKSKLLIILGFIFILNSCTIGFDYKSSSQTSIRTSSSGQTSSTVVEEKYEEPFPIINYFDIQREVGTELYNFKELYEEVLPSVVTVLNYQANSAYIGSGVIYQIETYEDQTSLLLLTNHHVIEKEERTEIVFSNKERLQGHVLASNDYIDVAIVRVDNLTDSLKNYVKKCKFGVLSNLSIGEQVAAIGSPLSPDYANSLTAGIVSNIDVPVSIDNQTKYAIQVDAAINPGNSGGPLFNLRGQVMGLNTMKIIANDVDLMGFAMPIDDLLAVAEILYENKTYTRVLLGVMVTSVSNLSLLEREELNIPNTLLAGVYVSEIVKNGAFAKANIPSKGIIIELDGKPIQNVAELSRFLLGVEKGEKISVKVVFADTTTEYMVEPQ